MKEEMSEKVVAPVSDWPVLPPKPLERGLLLVLLFNATRQEFFLSSDNCISLTQD